MNTANELLPRFQEVFGYEGASKYFSPGRINLIGDHTDYNGGKVFPSAITLGTYAVVSPRKDKTVRAFSENLSDMGIFSFSLENIRYEEESNWTNYVKGMLLYIQELKEQFNHGFDLYVYGTIPNGASLSSSASLEILIGVIANDIYNINLSGEILAKLGMRVENEFLKLNTGIMDQFIIANAKKEHALLLDANTLAYNQIPLNILDYKIVIMNSMTKRELVESAYNERRQQSEEALNLLQEVIAIDSLGELTISEFDKYSYLITDEVLYHRAKHVVYENQRTEKAAKILQKGNLKEFGELMNSSHLSLHEDYEVTIKETDLLVRLAWEQEGVVGARMTGGGFGGCCIAIVQINKVDEFTDSVGKKFENEIGFTPEFYVAETTDRARKL